MQNNLIQSQNGQTVHGNPNQNGEQPIRVETTVYGTPSKTNPDQFDDYTVETKMFMPDGQVYTNNQPLNHQMQPPSTHSAAPAPDTNPAGYVTPALNTDLRTYPQEVASMPFNGQPKTYTGEGKTTTVNTRVIDPPRERALIGQGQPTLTYSQNQQQYVQPVTVTAPNPNVTYEFPTFDAHRVPQHVNDTYQPASPRVSQPVYQSPSRAISAQPVSQPMYAAPQYQQVNTQPYTTVPVDVAAPAYSSPMRVSQPVYTTASPSRQQPIYVNNGGQNYGNYGNGEFRVDTTTRIYM